MKLCDLEVGRTSKMKRCLADSYINERLMSLGFVNGNDIAVIRKGPRGLLTIFQVSNSLIALRKEESSLIEVDDE